MSSMPTQPLPAYSFQPRTIESILGASGLITPDWAWGGSTGKGVRVAVIDSGIDAGHPAVGHVEGYVAVTDGEQGTLSFDVHEDLHGHGTACAGIIRSLAPDCELYSVKVLGAGLAGTATAFGAGIKWAIENGAHVASLSLGTTKPQFYAMLHQLSDNAFFDRTTLIAAANNLPTPSFPSTFASVISVAAHQESDPHRFYVNDNPPAEFSAPGVNVRVAWLDGSWFTATGNSFAAPHIAGIVAQILGKHPGLAPFEVKTLLRCLAANAGSGGADSPRSQLSPATPE